MSEKTYLIHEIFNTVQGEGARAGARSVFLRTAGCNLWNGRPEDRHKGKGACALWCDTSFVGGDKLTATEILERLDSLWPASDETPRRWVVISGGEPALQVDLPLIDVLHAAGWNVAMETNGTVDPHGALDAVDWLTVSPKLGGELVRRHGTELKVVLPGAVDGNGWTDEQLLALDGNGRWEHRFVQPQDPIMPAHVGATFLHGNLVGARPDYERNVRQCLAFVQAHPRWRISLQSHKLLGVP